MAIFQQEPLKSDSQLKMPRNGLWDSLVALTNSFTMVTSHTSGQLQTISRQHGETTQTIA
eukprot:1623090-Amphidinium_carterae.2